MDLMGHTCKEVGDPKPHQRRRGVYRGLEYQFDILTAGETRGCRGIFRGVAYGEEYLPEEKLDGALMADQVDHWGDAMPPMLPPSKTAEDKSFFAARE